MIVCSEENLHSLFAEFLGFVKNGLKLLQMLQKLSSLSSNEVTNAYNLLANLVFIHFVLAARLFTIFNVS